MCFFGSPQSMPCSLAFYSARCFSKHGVQPLEISLTANCNHRLWRVEIIKLDYIHISYLFITSYTLIHPQRQVKVSQDFHKETFHLGSNWKCKIRSELQQGSHVGAEALAYKWVCASERKKPHTNETPIQHYRAYSFYACWGSVVGRVIYQLWVCTDR